MGSKEKVVEVSKNGHGGVPDQIQEVLQEKKRANQKGLIMVSIKKGHNCIFELVFFIFHNTKKLSNFN